MGAEGTGTLPQEPSERMQPGAQTSPEDVGRRQHKISGTITDINGKSARNNLEHILSEKQIDSLEYDILYGKKIIAHNLKATKEQIR